MYIERCVWHSLSLHCDKRRELTSVVGRCMPNPTSSLCGRDEVDVVFAFDNNQARFSSSFFVLRLFVALLLHGRSLPTSLVKGKKLNKALSFFFTALRFVDSGRIAGRIDGDDDVVVVFVLGGSTHI
jgi:hypothetical protein